MEKPKFNTTNKVELPKVRQSIKSFLPTEQEKNIQEILVNTVYKTLGFKNEQSLEVKNKKIYEPRQGFYYRGIGEDGLIDAIESGFFRSPTMRERYKGIYKTSEIYLADADNFEVAKRASIRTNGSIMEGKSVIVEYPSVSEIIPKDRCGALDNYASQTSLLIDNARILVGDRITGIYDYVDFNQITPTDIEKLKEFVSKNKNK